MITAALPDTDADAPALTACPVPLIVGVTSHRNLARSQVVVLRAQVRAFFEELQQQFPELPLVLLSALAEGGDRLAADEALACGAKLIAVLPLPAKMYANDFRDTDSQTRFGALCARAEVMHMPLLTTPDEDTGITGAERDRQYASAGVFVASHCHILLALWDGRATDLLGGTGQIVRYHLDGTVPGVIERRRSTRPLLDVGDESLVYHIACSRDGTDGSVRHPDPPLQALTARWLSHAQIQIAEQGMPDAFGLMFRRMTEFNSDMSHYRERIAADTGAAQLDVIESLFNAADWLALHFQQRVLLAMRGIHVLAVLMGVAFVCYADLPSQDLMIYAFLLLFVLGLLLESVARRRDWHRKYIDYRALAEGLRVQRQWRNAGISATSSTTFAHDNFLQKQDIELGWIRHVMRAAGRYVALSKQSPPRTLATVIDEWIGAPGHGGQLDYYSIKSDERRQRDHATRNMGRICLWTGVAVSVLLALLRTRLDADTTSILVAIMGVLAIVAAARESYAYRKADKELIKQYRFMRSIFANARAALDATDDAEEQRAILRALGEAALAEHAEWTLMHRERPLEHGTL